jgi:hypothetical protein
VNIVCDGALLAGYARGDQTVDAGVIREVASDLQLSGEEGEFAAEGVRKQAVPSGHRRGGWLRRLGLR